MSETQQHVADMIAAARSSIENLDAAAAASELERGDTTFIDLREDAELEATGTIPGAVHVPRGMLEFRADPASPYHIEEFDPERRIVVYCASGGRSALAAETLQRMGYRKVAHLDGGYKAWQETVAAS
jgi:rhodanese-related sulfurtransferase